jgi:protein TonB
MKNNILLLVALLLAANSWSQEESEIGPKGEIGGEPILYVEDSNLVFQLVDVAAEFPGGREALFKYLATTIQYPPSAVKKKLEGKCYIQFVVEKNGTVSNPKIIRGVTDCPECDAEALRVVSIMPKWKPGEVDGKPVRSNFNLPVMFKL